MSNIKKIEESNFPVLFGEKTRPAETVNDKASLDLEGQAFESYAPKKGAIYRFTTFEDAIIKKQPVTEGGKAMQFLMLCEESLDGGKTFHTGVISLNSFAKRDANNVPCHPTWYDLGNIGKRAQKLCEMGQITVGTKERTIKVVVFDKGQPLKEMARDAEGKIITNANGEPTLVNKLKDAVVYDITPAV